MYQVRKGGRVETRGGPTDRLAATIRIVGLSIVVQSIFENFSLPNQLHESRRKIQVTDAEKCLKKKKSKIRLYRQVFLHAFRFSSAFLIHCRQRDNQVCLLSRSRLEISSYSYIYIYACMLFGCASLVKSLGRCWATIKNWANRKRKMMKSEMAGVDSATESYCAMPVDESIRHTACEDETRMRI